MAFSPFDFDVNVHSKLGDDPNVDNNLTADELKAVFDRPMVEFKRYINEVLIPALDSFSPESSIAVFIQEAKPQYAPCIWFRPLGSGLSEMNYVNRDGTSITIDVKSSVDSDSIKNGAVSSEKIKDNAVTTEKVRDRAITPEKLQKEYFEKGQAVVLTENVHYGYSLPAAGMKGRLFFKRLT